jgi:hypothetical protein
VIQASWGNGNVLHGNKVSYKVTSCEYQLFEHCDHLSPSTQQTLAAGGSSVRGVVQHAALQPTACTRCDALVSILADASPSLCRHNLLPQAGACTSALAGTCRL